MGKFTNVLFFAKRAGDVIMDWADELNHSFKDWQEANPSSNFLTQGLAKRSKAEEGDSGRAAKKPKTSNDFSDQDMKRHYEKDTLKKVRDWLV
jgi:hypothetical protein